jgi:superfamily II DNA/RNA helicase
VDVLIGTDLISRGIDVVDCKNVIIFDMPDSIEDYVHRSGRTGRFGREGVCTAFLTYECTIARDLRRLLKESKQPIPKELEDLKMFGGEVIKTGNFCYFS